jgi:phosphoribosylamine--glycine ligase
MTGDFGELLYSAARGSLDPSPVGWSDGATACVVMAAPGYPGTYEKGIEIEGFAAAEAGGAKVFHAGTRFKQGRIASSGGRVLGVTAAGSNLRAALDTAYGAVDKLSFPRAHFRKDIGARAL